MKIHYTKEMQQKILVYVTAAGISLAIYFFFQRFDNIKAGFMTVFNLILPFVLGFAIAFLLNSPMKFIERKLLKRFNWKKTTKRRISAISAVLLGLCIVALFFALLIPQLIESVLHLAKRAPSYIESFQELLDTSMVRYNLNMDQIADLIGKKPDILNNLTDMFTSAIPQMVKLSYQFTSALLNIVLGIMAGLYILLDKERFLLHVKKANYALFPKDVADYLVRTSRDTALIFNNFIIGKAIDSMIIGILCYIGMMILHLPYALLLSVTVGVTNMIPVFGPFIGAVPGIVILLIIHPIYAVYFAIFVLILQQFDGNILGPLILGDKLGLPSLWILFAVVVGGGLFGVVGMFIGVPIFAVIYAAVREFLNFRLERKKMEVSIKEDL